MVSDKKTNVNISLQNNNVKMISKVCQCGKAIPGCAICLEPIGIMNYQVELQRIKQQM